MAACQNSVVLTTRPPRIRDSWQEPGLPIPCQARGTIHCRPALDFHGFSGPIHADCSPYSNGAIIHSRSLHTHPQSPCIPIPPYWPHARRDRRGIAVGLHRRPLVHISRPLAIHKKPQSPQAHVSQAIHRNPCLAASHTPRIPIQAISSYNHSLTMLPPRPAAGLRGSTHQANSLKFPAPTRGAWASVYGIASRCVGVSDDAASASTTEGASTCVVRPEGRTDSRA